MSGGAPYGADYDMSEYVADEDDFWEHASDADLDEASTNMSGQIFVNDISAGFKMGAAAGPIGAGIGAIVGLIIGAVDADLSKKALMEQMVEDRALKREIAQDIKDAMSYRLNIVRHAEALLHPVEQAFRTRSRIFAAQFSQRGLTGSQAIAAQLQAESMYREQVGPALPAVMAAAQAEGTAGAMLRLTAVERKYGIDLGYKQQQLQRDALAARLAGNKQAGIVGGLADMGVALAGGLEDLITSEQEKAAADEFGGTGASGGDFEFSTGDEAAATDYDFGDNDVPDDVLPEDM